MNNLMFRGCDRSYSSPSKVKNAFRRMRNVAIEGLRILKEDLSIPKRSGFAYATVGSMEIPEKKVEEKKPKAMRMDALELIGYAATALSSIQLAPQVFKAFKTKSTKDLSWGTLGLIAGGICLWTVYVIGLGSGPLIVNQITVGTCTAALIYAKLKYG
ncbi:hypothetical protein HYT84_01590 [Candidatus Micrarchaeota archaeon]|nr:hypothetical protein [Candidatus Micrarchaeota archaeon]